MIRRLGVWKERQSFDRGLNEARVYRNLGIFFLRRGHFQDKNRARSFLKAALIQGDEKAYLIYHFHFSKNKKVIDDRSYQEIYQDYLQESSWRKRRLLEGYLRLGNKKQKKSIGKL